MTASPATNPWLVCPRPDPAAAVRLFCFPYAGGGAGVFRRWAAQLPAGIELCAVQLPGREGRLRERAFDRMTHLVSALAAALRSDLDRPFAFFGHSLGALVAFELARRLRREGRSGPVHLFASGRRAPQLGTIGPPRHDLPEAQFREALRHLGGTPREVLDNDELMDLLSPTVRADFAVAETYRYEPGAPLDCPITVLGGQEDPNNPPDRLHAWAEHTHADFRVRMAPGGHFFLHSATARVLEVVAGELAPLLPADSRWPAVAAVPALGANDVHVWRAPLEQPPPSLEALEQTLSPDERQRAERFHFPRDRRHFIAGRGILRTLLSRYLGQRPDEIQFCYNPHGKPRLCPETTGLHFNLAHSHGLALYAVSRGRELGVDLERVRADFDGEQLAQRFFSPREAAGLRSLPAAQRREAFFSCWTRKEAYLKATGMGLSLALDRFDVSLAPAAAALLATRHDSAEARRWSLCDLAPGLGYTGALAVEGHGWRLWSAEWAGVEAPTPRHSFVEH
jgi:medium-chain acyl-[acyl-carrier-protein] hydrolase